MTAAAASFNTRQYNDAIMTYHAAESLIYSQLDPQWEPELGPKIRPFLPRDPSLFSPLLSSTSQWLNILAVPSAASPVRPTSAVNPSLLSTASNVHGAGLNVVDPNAANASEALADMRLAAIYADEGNTGASSVAVTRAQGLDPTLATALNPKPAGNTLAAASAGGFVASPALTLNPSADLTAFQIPIESHPTLPITVLTQKQLGLITGSAGQYTVQSIQWRQTPARTSLKSRRSCTRRMRPRWRCRTRSIMCRRSGSAPRCCPTTISILSPWHWQNATRRSATMPTQKSIFCRRRVIPTSTPLPHPTRHGSSAAANDSDGDHADPGVGPGSGDETIGATAGAACGLGAHGAAAYV